MRGTADYRGSGLGAGMSCYVHRTVAALGQVNESQNLRPNKRGMWSRLKGGRISRR